MWYEDLSIYGYLDEENTKPIYAIGWLENGKPYPTGKIQPEVYEKLSKLVENPWIYVLACGVHECDFCYKVSGNLNLTIPYNGKIYECPELITHYIEKHSYLPPKEFCEAVLACPPMDSVEYKQKIVENGGEPLAEYFECLNLNESYNRTN